MMDETRTTDSSQEMSHCQWACLPHVALSQIFQHLSCLDRICASHVCLSWFTASSSKDTWKSFDFSEKDTREWKLDLKELKGPIQLSEECLQTENLRIPAVHLIYLGVIIKYGKYVQDLSLIFDGTTENTTVSDELSMSICRESSNLKRIRLQNISSERYKEPFCSLLQKNRYLECINLVSVKFKSKNEPLPIGLHHVLTLRKLYLVNSFQSYNLGTLMYLVNLKELSIEPQLLSYSLLYHLAGHSLRNLYIVAISKMTGFYQEAMQDWHWREICKQGPKFRVHFRFSSSHEWTEKEIILKPSIPVKSMIYYKYRLVHFIPLKPLVLQYSSTLEVFIDFSIAMASYEAAQTDKDIVGMNKCLLDIVKNCQNLRRFAVKEVLASSTLLAMVTLNANLKELYVMQEQVMYKNLTDTTDMSDWEAEIVNENWTDEKFQEKMSYILGTPWRPLPSAEYFKQVSGLCNNFV